MTDAVMMSEMSTSLAVKVPVAARPAFVSASVAPALSPASAVITGASLVPVMLIVSVVVAVPPWPSEMV